MEKVRRYSPKREAILACLRSTDSHPAAEWVYAQLKPSIPDLSLATVYRNLAQFRQDGSVTVIGNVNGEERYDADTHPHAHFVCTCCGAVLDLPDCAPSRQYIQSLSMQYGFTVEEHECNLRGLCSDCKKKITLEETVS